MQWKQIVCQFFLFLRQELLKRLDLQSQASMSQIYRPIGCKKIEQNKSNAIKRQKCRKTCSTTKNLLKRKKIACVSLGLQLGAESEPKIIKIQSRPTKKEKSNIKASMLLGVHYYSSIAYQITHASMSRKR